MLDSCACIICYVINYAYTYYINIYDIVVPRDMGVGGDASKVVTTICYYATLLAVRSMLKRSKLDINSPNS